MIDPETAAVLAIFLGAWLLLSFPIGVLIGRMIKWSRDGDLNG